MTGLGIVVSTNIALIVLIIHCSNKSDEKHGDEAQGWAFGAVIIMFALALFDVVMILAALSWHLLGK